MLTPISVPILPPQSVLGVLSGGGTRNEELLRQGHEMPGEPKRCSGGEEIGNGEAETGGGGEPEMEQRWVDG